MRPRQILAVLPPRCEEEATKLFHNNLLWRQRSIFVGGGEKEGENTKQPNGKEERSERGLQTVEKREPGEGTKIPLFSSECRRRGPPRKNFFASERKH